ncbi:MAG TPA: hypothetical protein VIP11_15515, partial [Gemmatimonadaceae bacterium]
AVPVRGGIGFVQPRYRWRPPNVPSLFRVTTLAGDTARSIAPNAAAPTRPPETQPAPGDLKATVNALYTTMREALKRGDWAAFGRAFDALGRALGRPQGTP